jgi:fatty acid desaturase
MLMEPRAVVLRWLLGSCVAIALLHVVGWFVFGFLPYTLWSLAGVLCTAVAVTLSLRELRKRERRGDDSA